MAATATTIAYNNSAFSRQPVDYNNLTYRGGEQARAGPSTQRAEHGDSEWRKAAHTNSNINSSTYAPPPSSFHQQGPKGKGRSVDHGNGHIFGGDGHGSSPTSGEREHHQTNRHREAVDPFGRDLRAASGQEAASSAHGHTQESYYNDEQADRGRMLTRERGWSGSSKYSESIATFGDGGGGSSRHGMDYLPHTNTGAAVSSHQSTGPTITFPHMHVDVPGDEIGASPIPVRRVQQQHGYGHVRQMSAGRGSASGHNHSDNAERERGYVAPATTSPRDSFASFWTFGRGSIRRGQTNQQTSPSYVAAAGPGAEPQSSRVATSSRQPGVGVLRDRSATLGGRAQHGTSLATEGPAPSQGSRPRANTAAQLSVSTAVPAVAASTAPVSHIYPQSSQYLQQPAVDAASSSEGGDTYNSSYHHHPYAQVMPPTGHREHSRLVQRTQKRGSLLNLNLNVPFLSSSRSLANLRDSANRLKSSVSTPNLRQGANTSGRSGNGSVPKTPSTATSSKWLSAETWCDALLFPRPRFRMRTAHVISPPDSPTRADTQGPPYSAPPETEARTAKKNILRRKESKEAFQQGSSGQYGNGIGNGQNLGRQSPPRTGHGGGVEDGGGEVTKSNTLRPPRPKSFAQDDLALLASPVPSLNTVLKQNEDFNKEREQWKAAAAHSFQNKRSRSFSRTHTRAKAMLAARLADDQSELVTSFDIIATSAFHGTQAMKANVSTNHSSSASRSVGNSTGLNTVSTHSRKSSGASGNNAGVAVRGHVRKESWSKSALKTAKSTAAGAAGLCKYTEDMSPADEKFISLEEVKKLKGDFDGPVMQRVTDDGVLLIAPNATYQPHLTLPRANAGTGEAKAISPVPSTQSGDSGTGQSGVGIAVSTPSAFLVPETQDEAFSFSAHPYASHSQWQSQRSNPGAVERDLPRPSEYAGPHPSLLTDHLYTDVAAHNIAGQHRAPNNAAARTTSTSPPPMKHPFASPRARPALLNVPAANNGNFRTISPQRSMFAEVGTGTIREVMSDEIQYSPYSARHPGSSGRNSDALGVEEALSVAFSRESMENMMRDGLRSGDGDEVRRERDGSRDTSGTASPVPQAESQHVFVVSSHPYRSEVMPQIDEITRESWAASSLADDMSNGVGSNAALAVPPFARQQSLPLSVGSGRSHSHSTSPGQVSINSSPMASPRQFRKFDDEEDYSDLFYRPVQPASALGNEIDVRGSGGGSKISSRPSTGNSSKAITPPALVRSDSGSALTNLQRQLSQSYGRGDRDRRMHKAHDGYNDRMRELQEVDEELLSSNPGSSPPGTTLPLRVPLRNQNTDPTHLIPEDVESERASSVMGRYETEDGTEIFYRLGEVPSLLTPDPVSKPQRSSAHGSYFGEHGDSSEHNAKAEREHDDDVVLMDHSLTRPRRGHATTTTLTAPLSAGPTSATTDGTGTRASYLTSTSSTSRISNLSDFPSPPTQASLTPGRVLDAYFTSPTPGMAAEHEYEHEHERAQALASADVRSVQREMEREREREARRSRRTTFGPIEEDSDRDVNVHSDS